MADTLRANDEGPERFRKYLAFKALDRIGGADTYELADILAKDWNGVVYVRADLVSERTKLIREQQRSGTGEITAVMVSCRRCTVCEGLDHHWIEECDDDHPEGIMACKHCPATREIRDEDFADLNQL